MKNFLQYIQTSRKIINATDQYKNIFIVLGNESCDLDSTVSSLLLGFLLYTQLIKTNNNDTLVVPVMNVSNEVFLLRTEGNHVIKQCHPDIFPHLTYRNDISFEELLKNKTVNTHLVDHHVLADRDKILEDSVIRIYDHRPVNQTAKWDNSKVNVTIEQVGSCATLIANEILNYDKDILNKSLAYILYQTIIFDTIALLPENKRVEKLDIQVAEKLEEKFKFELGRKALFDKLWEVHNDVSHLTTKQLLFKDMKIIEGIPIPGLPMLVEDFLNIENVYNDIKIFANNFNTSIVVFVGLDTKNNQVKRDVGIYFKDNNLKDVLIKNLKVSESSKGYNFNFTEVATKYNDVLCFRQGNIKLSRKQIVPIVQDTLVNYNKLK